MPFERPTLNSLVTQAQADFVSRLEAVGSVLRNSLVYIFARVLAGAIHLLYGFIAWAVKQIFPDQSDDDNMLRQAALFGITPKGASFAQPSVTVTGTSGVVIPAGTILQRSDGVTYSFLADALIFSGTVTATVQATSDYPGANANVSSGDPLDFQSPIAGATSPAIVAPGGVDGADDETPDQTRARFLAFLRDPPQGGSVADFQEWTLQVQGVTRAWISPLELGPGTVLVRFVRDNDTGGIIPDSGEVAAVQAYLDSVRPAAAVVTAAAPVADAIAFSVHLVPSNASTQAAVAAELADVFLRLASPGGTVPLSQLRTAIGNATGVTDYTLASPAADVVSATGHLATLGSITFT